MIIVRPDQYVSHVLPLQEHDALVDFFAGILVDPGQDPKERMINGSGIERPYQTPAFLNE
jgi:hypothetical protein